METVDLAKAKQILSSIDPKSHFIIRNGRSIKSLVDLSESLKLMSNEDFSHHVNPNNNDFSNWVKNIVKDEDLGDTILNLKGKGEIQKAIEQRVGELKQIELRPAQEYLKIIGKTEEEIKKEVNARIEETKQKKIQAKQETKQKKIKTSADKLLKIVNKKKRISFEDCANQLRVPESLIEKWAESLELQGLIKTEYNLTKRYMIDNSVQKKKKRAKQEVTEESKESTPVLMSESKKKEHTYADRHEKNAPHIFEEKMRDYAYGIIVGTIAGVMVGLLL